MTDHGPVANRILPEPARSTHEVISLRWVGLELSDELRALLKLNRARTVNEARDALRNWHCPTWNFIIADADGHVGYQCVGSIPVRTRNERGYRKGWDAEDEWQGFIPYDELPALRDPPRGWIASANNRVAPDEFPHFLSGFWTGSHRMERCREMLMEQEKFSVDDFKRMHFDTVSKRAEGLMPHLLAVIKGEPQFAAVIERLRKTDFRYDEDSVAATMFETFFIEWEKTVLRERLPLETHALLLPQSAMLANQLLKADEFGWFKNGDREQKIREAFAAAMAWLSSRVSPNPSTWRWDKVHTVTFKHPLALNDFAARVFNVGPFPHHGSPTSVNNAGYDPQNPFHTTSGVSYRLIADLSTQELWGINTTGQSGNPASPHYCDQTEDWRTGKYHAIPLRRDNGVME
jgi:penicillin amidase